MPFEGLHNEKELLMRVAHGDREAYRIVYTACYPHVQRIIALYETSGSVRDELTQDVFVRIWEKRGRLGEVESFKGYLFKVTRNVVLNFFRALKVRQRVMELDESAVVGENDLEDELLFKQYYRIAIEAMEKLPPGRRKVFSMSIDDGLTLDEIAAQLHITRSGVKKQLYAATAFVRQYMRERGGIGSPGKK